MTRRDQLRAQARAQRRGMTQQEWQTSSAAITERILSWSAYREANILLLYYPIGREILLQPVLEDALSSGKTLFLPRTNPDFTLSFFEVEDLSALQDGPMGTKEPAGGTIYDKEQGGLCLVPGLCFDFRGGRLGYGKGCYDRFLKNFKGTIAAPSYDWALLSDIDAQKNDIPVHFFITETKVHLTGAGGIIIM